MTNGHTCYLEVAEAKFYILFIEFHQTICRKHYTQYIVANLIFIIVCVLSNPFSYIFVFTSVLVATSSSKYSIVVLASVSYSIAPSKV